LASREDAIQLIQELTALESDQRFQNLVAQSHSRAILLGLRTPSATWPDFTIIDDDMVNTAHYLFWQGLQIKTIPEYAGVGDRFIKLGCEILEFVYAPRDSGYTDRVKQLFNAALGYYISGYYARAYVLMQDLQLQGPLPQELELLRMLFTRDLSAMRGLISTILNDPLFSDEAIAVGLRAATISEDEALHRIHQAALNKAFSYFLEYPKNGIPRLLQQARNIIDRGIALSLKTGYADWWWLFNCARYLLDEFDSNSLWTVLGPLGGGDPEKQIIEPYIRANYLRQRPIIELWRSQKAAMPFIGQPRGKSYCLKMPTSAGKTRIAELTILRFLLDTINVPNAKCLYIAPFRSLAIEVEHALQESFHPLGRRVSELYGGFDLNPIERLLIEETHVIVATPEKVNAFLRYNPEIADEIKLIIVDEGHIISLSERGLRFEFFLQRLIRKFANKHVRFLFVSAVLPNADEFAQWITGDPANLIESTWRPSRLLLGELRWNGRSARIDYLEADHEQLGHPCFVPNFITPIDPRGLRGTNFRRLFPHDITEVAAEAGIRFAQNGTTMIFCTRKDSVQTVSRAVMRSLEIHSALADKDGLQFGLPKSERFEALISNCVNLSYEYMGHDNDVATYLKAGFAIHNSDIPKPVRIELESLVRSGAVHLIVATTTLAQGVNFPIQTVLVHGLSHGQGDDLSPMTFWNICGRAGRGMFENEGQILFIVDLDLPQVKLVDPTGLSDVEIARRTDYKREMRLSHENEIRHAIVAGYTTYRLVSSIQQLLARVEQIWKSTHPNSNLGELCLLLADGILDWAPPEQEKNIETWLEVLDTELLAMIQEESLTDVSPDTIQHLIQGSLAILQAEKTSDGAARIQQIRDLLFARWQYVASMTQADNARSTAERRRKFYRLGFSVHDCQTIEAESSTLLLKLQDAKDYQQWAVDDRCTYLQGLINFLIHNVSALKPDRSVVLPCWDILLSLWLRGYVPDTMVAHENVSQYTKSPAVVSAFIEDVFVNKLPWGLNALVTYLSDMAADEGTVIPYGAAYFAALVKYGVHDLVASCLLAFGTTPRQLALQLSTLYPYPDTEASAVLSWFLHLGQTDLATLNLPPSDLEAIQRAQTSARLLRGGTVSRTAMTTIQVLAGRRGAVSLLSLADILELRPLPGVSPKAFSLLMLTGAEIGTYELSEPIPTSWAEPARTSTQVVNIETVDDASLRLTVNVETM
jgi:hypothetical protein